MTPQSRHMVIVKAHLHREGRRETLYLPDLSAETWNDKVENLLHDEWKRVISEPMEVIVECHGRITPKRPIAAVEDPASSPPRQRQTRTALQEAQLQHRIDENEQQGNYAYRLFARWKCKDTRCRNFSASGLCFVDYNRKHYSSDANA